MNNRKYGFTYECKLKTVNVQPKQAKLSYVLADSVKEARFLIDHFLNSSRGGELKEELF